MGPAGAAPERRAVLITRPEAEAASTAAQVAARGLVPVIAPLLRVEALRPALPTRIQAVLAASGNAVAALPPLPVKLLAVGDATAARARARGFTEVYSAGRDAEALAGLAAQLFDPAGPPLLLAAGRGQGGALAARLRDRGFRVIRRAVYAASPVPAFPPAASAALEAGTLRAALFLSAETARVFCRLLPAGLRPSLGSVEALAIGEPAALALKAVPWRHVRVAARPTLDEVLALL